MPDLTELGAVLADVDREIDHESERLYALRAKTGDDRGWELVPTPDRGDGRLMKYWTVREESATQLIIEMWDYGKYSEALFRKIGAFGWVKDYKKYPEIRIYAVLEQPRPLASGSARKWLWTCRYTGHSWQGELKLPPAPMYFPMKFGT